MTETVLVTGGTGFVGSWCIVALLQCGYAVRTTVRSATREAAVRAAIGSEVSPGDRLSFAVADLTSDAGWDAAVAGCDHVLHVASPLGVDDPKDANELIVPARDGTLRVLGAATRAGVRRVVMTSSVAAASPRLDSGDCLSDEMVWTDPTVRNVNAYRRSKTFAERAAWDFMRRHDGPTRLTTVLPSAILGPVLSPEGFGSVQLVQRLLNGKMPGSPRLGFNVVDVRDVAELHIRAMTAPAAAGERFIAAGDFMWIADMARLLRDKLGQRAVKAPTRMMPDVVLRLVSIFDRPLRAVTPGLGRKHSFSSAKAARMLDWTPRPAAATVVDCAKSLIAWKAV